MKNKVLFVSLILSCLVLGASTSYANTRKITCNLDNEGSAAAVITISSYGHKGYDSYTYTLTILDETIIRYFLKKEAVNYTDGNRILFDLNPIENTYHHYKAISHSNNHNTYYVKRIGNGLKVEAFKGNTANAHTFIADWYFNYCGF